MNGLSNSSSNPPYDRGITVHTQPKQPDTSMNTTARLSFPLATAIAAASLLSSTGAWAEPHEPYEWPDNQPAECPFPQSEEITKIVFTGRYANYTQADTWFPMWAADGNEYSPFTDGMVDGYMSVGHYTNMAPVYYNKNHRTGQARMEGDDPANPKQCIYACSMHEIRFVTASDP